MLIYSFAQWSNYNYYCKYLYYYRAFYNDPESIREQKTAIIYYCYY